MWDETRGQVSRSFDEWALVDRDIRGFMKLGLRFCRQAYAAIWEAVEAQPGWEDPRDVPDIFHKQVDGLWPHDFEWMHLSAVLKDALTAYEVYLDHAMEEVLGSHGLSHSRPHPGWTLAWRDLKRFFRDYLDVDVCPSKVEVVVKLRHILTHRRGELRTEAERSSLGEKFGSISSHQLNLCEADVHGHLDALASAARSTDSKVYRFSWGGQRIPKLQQEYGTL